MPRYAKFLAALVTATTLAANGCRSCSSCHDYDPPVAECYCDAHGTHRCGSVSAGGCGCSGCSSGGCSTGDCATGGCNCGNHDGGGNIESGENAYLEDEYAEGFPVEAP